ncbi:hypothetical protein CHARACLAT_025279 [Characodon lateralis]|uniref:Uncharacterized protein n=1 Tax=Characodon lateralis TaxID=208331 RepID=A0ABU7F5Y3_9TELE|nr:hypothetical protein [Characodon lateralis]
MLLSFRSTEDNDLVVVFILILLSVFVVQLRGYRTKMKEEIEQAPMCVLQFVGPLRHAGILGHSGSSVFVEAVVLLGAVYCQLMVSASFELTLKQRDMDSASKH